MPSVIGEGLKPLTTRWMPIESSHTNSNAGYDYSEEFEFGLDFIIDGLTRYRRGLAITMNARAPRGSSSAGAHPTTSR
jgi:hypothetical protein